MRDLLLNQWFTNSIMKALAWTFVHSLWQGLFAALLAVIIIYATKKRSARLRYNLLGTVILVFLVTAFITFFSVLKQQFVSIASVTPISTTTFTVNPAIESTTRTIDAFSSWINGHANLLMPVWTLLFLFNCLKLFSGLFSANRLRYYKIHPVSKDWKLKVQQLKDSLDIPGYINILQSELVKVPVVLGVLRPIILMPLGLLSQLPVEQIEAILLHELAHIRRRDFLVNFLQHFAEAIFFFNPALIWISSLVRQEREACCDDIAVAKTGRKRNYVEALVSFQEYSLNKTPFLMAIGSKRNYLLNRVKRIISNENKTLNVFEKAALLTGIIIFSAFSFIDQKKTAPHTTIPAQELIVAVNYHAASNKSLPLYPKAALDTISVNAIIKKTAPVKKKNPVKSLSTQLVQNTATKLLKHDTAIVLPVKQIENEETPKSKEEILEEIKILKEQIVIEKLKLEEVKHQGIPDRTINYRTIQVFKRSVAKAAQDVVNRRGQIELKRKELQALAVASRKRPVPFLTKTTPDAVTEKNIKKEGKILFKARNYNDPNDPDEMGKNNPAGGSTQLKPTPAIQPAVIKKDPVVKPGLLTPHNKFN